MLSLRMRRPGGSRQASAFPYSPDRPKPSRFRRASLRGPLRNRVDEALLFAFETALGDQPRLSTGFADKTAGTYVGNPNLNRPQTASTEACPIGSNFVSRPRRLCRGHVRLALVTC